MQQNTEFQPPWHWLQRVPRWHSTKNRLPHAAVGCVGGYCLGTLPDLIEPATSPHHRQFFHSLLFAAAIGYGLYRTYKWEPATIEGKIVRSLCLIAGGAYLVHLALDATTKRSLPVLGKI